MADVSWRIWYDNGTNVEGSTLEEWNGASCQGVLIVKSNRVNHMGLDYYWLEDDTVKSCNRSDIDRYLVRPGGIQAVKLGRWSSNYVWEQARKEASEHNS